MPLLDPATPTKTKRVDSESDDGADPELVELLRQHLGLSGKQGKNSPPETKVLENAQYIFDNAIDVALNPAQTKEAAETIWQMMQKKSYSTQTWSDHELHPQTKDENTVDFIFLMDLLNFSFWSEETDESKRFCIEYRGRRWTGYWSLVAAIQRALDEGIPITSPDYWVDEGECTEEQLRYVFRSATDEEIPLFEERVRCMREAGEVLCDEFGGSFANCIDDANQSAAALVNLVTDRFDCFRDETVFNGKRVRLYKRAQILVADLWACFNGEDFGEFHDIDKITMFADYRIPQMLHQLGCMRYSPSLESHIRSLKPIAPGSQWEVELRGTSIWCVELIRREIEKRHPEVKAAGTKGITTSHDGSIDQQPKTHRVNAILIDFFLYDTMKTLEKEKNESIPHHRTRSIWY
ncbi:Queuosine salvage protein [Penicillium oxalicum]|uniref:Queuosine salvage protein n=1 Tax=Penicillium oxalicum TaxID=69781 RepID=UPI0020B7242B|nr:Queuosine salvage protein [Penicillium oxalicum]KAI2789418.1 Queuosine salvage protein [Penicillium oxalicum]